VIEIQDQVVNRPEEPEQLAFELNSYLHLVNDAFVLSQDETFIKRGGGQSPVSWDSSGLASRKQGWRR
jgi:hypothetical protein